MPNFKSEKLRVNLRLCINRLKLLEKKKSESVGYYLDQALVVHTIFFFFFSTKEGVQQVAVTDCN